MGILLLIFPVRSDRIRNVTNFIFVLMNSTLAIIAMLNCQGENIVIIKIYMNYGFEFEIDKAAAIFGTIVAGLWPFASLYAYGYMAHQERKNTFFAFFTMTYGIVLGIAFSSNLLTMYVFYEMLTLVTFPLVLHPMTQKAVKAAKAYLAYSLGGAAFGLIGLIFMMHLGSTGFVLGGSIPESAQDSVFLLPAFVLSFCGFSVKAAMAPFSGWLIKAAVAPTPVTALLHAVAVVNAGAFACIRLTYFVFGTDILYGTWAQYLVMALAIITIVYGSSFAVKEGHFKRRLAYSTISNLSYILFAATIMTPMGLTAAFAHMLMHSLTKICSFFCCGTVMEQTGKEYVKDLDGMGRIMKLSFGCFTISSLSLIGIPMFCGFFSKWRIGLAAVSDAEPLTIAGLCALLFSALLTGIYMLSIVIRAYFPVRKNTDKENEPVIHEHCWQMLLPIACFAFGIILLGVFWQPVLDFVSFI
ncbi:MAG: proton-conducting membrane transporter [Lachnospiraceae bacterium]|nr:proton-conducting membrane transporter [Lachnospiraceae bacterium]